MYDGVKRFGLNESSNDLGIFRNPQGMLPRRVGITNVFQ